MNTNSKILKWSVVLLALLNIALLLTLWLRPGRGQGDRMPGPPEDSRPADLLIEQLKFTSDQTAKFDVLKKEHRDSIEQLRKDGHELRNSFFDLLKSDSVDQKKVEDFSLSIANNQKAIEMATFSHFAQVRKLCDAKQKVIFDDIINDILRKMAGPKRQGPENGPPPQHP